MIFEKEILDCPLTVSEALQIVKRLEYDASWDKCGPGYYKLKKALDLLKADD